MREVGWSDPMAAKTFIGRRSELDLLIKELSRMNTSRNEKRLITLTGPVGVGKRSLLTAFWKGREENLPCLRVSPGKGEVQSEEGEIGWVHRLTDGLQANQATLELAVTQMRARWEEAAAELSSGEESSMGNLHTFDTALSTWVEIFSELFILHPAHRQNLQIIFEIHDFDQFSVGARQSLSALLGQPLSRYRVSPDIRFLLTCQQSPKHSYDLHTYWKPFVDHYQELAVAPLTVEEVAAWLDAEELPSDIAESLHKRTEGMPGKLPEAAEALLDELNREKWIEQASALLKGKSDSQVLGLCRAALLGEISEDSLRVFMDAPQAREFVKWVSTRPELRLRTQGGAFFLPRELQRAFVRFFEHSYAADYKRDKVKAVAFAEALEALGPPTDRKMLTQLAPFTYFNREVLAEIHGTASRFLIEFAENSPGRFDHRNGNFKINNATRRLLDRYLSITRQEPGEDLSRRINECWARARENILARRAQAEAQLKGQEKAMEDVRRAMLKLQKEMQAERDKMQRLLNPAEDRRSRHSAGGKSVGGSVLLQIVGVGILYVSLLMVEKFTVVYAGVGVAFIFAGLFLQTKKSPVTAPSSGTSKPVVNTAAFEKNLEFMGHKQTQLQNKIKALRGKFQQNQAEIREFDSLLREPYS